MVSEVLVKPGTPIEWDDAGTDYAITLDGLTDGSGRQGEKGDLGAKRAAQFSAVVTLDVNVSPVAGSICTIYWAASPHATAGTENPGAATGADAAYTIANATQLQVVGAFVCRATTDDQRQVFLFSPPHRYGMPIIINNCGQTFASAGAGSIKLVPIVDEIQ